MDMIDERSERNSRSVAQEMTLVSLERKKGNVAYRVAQEFDVMVIERRTGIMCLVECKFSDNDVFYVDKYDIARGLDTAKRLASIMGIEVKYRIDMLFSNGKNKRRYIEVSPEDRGFTIRCNNTAKKIMTKRVKRGKLKKARLT